MIRASLHISEVSASSNLQRKKNVTDIEFEAKKNNVVNQITGVLAHDQYHYFHIVEGPEQEVGLLLNKIDKDHRNKNFQVILDLLSNERFFDDWTVHDGHSRKQSDLFCAYLLTNLDALPLLEDREFEILEKFVSADFY